MNFETVENKFNCLINAPIYRNVTSNVQHYLFIYIFLTARHFYCWLTDGVEGCNENTYSLHNYMQR